MAAGEWWDAIIKTTARGYSTAEAPFWVRPFLKHFEKRRRLPDANWFALVGMISKDDRSMFVMGVGPTVWKPQVKGELRCFANDVSSAYWNNFRSITLTVTRIR